MKRGDDLIRQLLFRFEESDSWEHEMPASLMGYAQEEVREGYHVLLMIDDGLMIETGQDMVRMTAAGHDFLDAIRSDTVWNKTNEGAKAVGGVTLGILKDIAVAYLKKEVSSRLGIEV